MDFGAYQIIIAGPDVVRADSQDGGDVYKDYGDIS